MIEMFTGIKFDGGLFEGRHNHVDCLATVVFHVI